MTETITTYLVIHGVTTVGAVIIFLIRNEHRITKLETTLTILKEQHDRLTAKGTAAHTIDHQKPTPTNY